MPFRILLAWLVFLALQPLADAAASSISLKIQSRATFGRNLQVSLQITNEGDESAFSVTPEIQGEGISRLLAVKDELKPGQTYEVEEILALNSPAPGTYALRLTMHYADANHYPFSAVAPVSYVVGKESPSQIAVIAKNTELPGEGPIKFMLKNLRRSPLAVKVTLPLPKALTCGNAVQKLRLNPGGIKILTFDVRNVTGLENSVYALFAVLDYETDGIHHSDIANVVVKLTRTGKPRGFSVYWIPVFLFCLAILYRLRI